MDDNTKQMCMQKMKYKGPAMMLVAVMLSLFLLVQIFNGLKEYHYIGKNPASQNTIVVNGKGELAVKPDIATVSFSVMQEDKDVSKASNVVNTKIANIVNALKGDGIDEKDIKTTGYNVYPRYDYINSQTYPVGGGRQVLAGYDVTQSIEVKIRDISKAGKIIADLGGLGVTDMSGLTFTEDKYDELVRQARDMAISDARDQAKKLASALGVSLGDIVSYSEGGSYPVPLYAKAGVGYGMGGDTVATVPTGENKITSNVSITYEIK